MADIVENPRKSVWNPERNEVFFEGLRNGLKRPASALIAGMKPDTMLEWLARGRGTDKRPDREDGRYEGFLTAVEKAEAECIAACLALIQEASLDHNHWTAAAWMAERIDPANYGKKQTTKIEGVIEHRTKFTFAEPPIPIPEAAPVEVIDVTPTHDDD